MGARLITEVGAQRGNDRVIGGLLKLIQHGASYNLHLAFLLIHLNLFLELLVIDDLIKHFLWHYGAGKELRNDMEGIFIAKS